MYNLSLVANCYRYVAYGKRKNYFVIKLFEKKTLEREQNDLTGNLKFDTRHHITTLRKTSQIGRNRNGI